MHAIISRRQAAVALLMDREGHITEGSEHKLVQMAKEGADLQISLDARAYLETVPVPNVIVRGNALIATQPHHVSSRRKLLFDNQAYKAVPAFASDGTMIMLRLRIRECELNKISNIPNFNVEPRGHYGWYRWLARPEWKAAGILGEADGLEQDTLGQAIITRGIRVKLGVNVGSVTYIGTPCINYLYDSETDSPSLGFKLGPFIGFPEKDGFQINILDIFLRGDGRASLRLARWERHDRSDIPGKRNPYYVEHMATRTEPSKITVFFEAD